jgi:hypothetical protein
MLAQSIARLLRSIKCFNSNASRLKHSQRKRPQHPNLYIRRFKHIQTLTFAVSSTAGTDSNPYQYSQRRHSTQTVSFSRPIRLRQETLHARFDSDINRYTSDSTNLTQRHCLLGTFGCWGFGGETLGVGVGGWMLRLGILPGHRINLAPAFLPTWLAEPPGCAWGCLVVDPGSHRHVWNRVRCRF